MSQSDLLSSLVGNGDDQPQDEHDGAFPARRHDDVTSMGVSGRPVHHRARIKWRMGSYLIAGIVVAPCVVVFGMTFLSFNHRERASDRSIRAVGPAEVVGTALEGFPTASALARALVDELNARAGDRSFHMVDDGDAAFTRPILVKARGHGHEHIVWFDPDSGSAMIRTAIAAAEHPKWWPTRGRVILADPPHDRLVRGVPALLDRFGLESDSIRLPDPPDLLCTVEADGRRWRIAYNIQTGVISTQPAGSPSEALSGLTFVTGLDVPAGHPIPADPRRFFAFALPVLAAGMVFRFGCGVVAWWRRRSLRRAGLIATGTDILAGALMILAVYAMGVW
jgi:hypothetical protein